MLLSAFACFSVHKKHPAALQEFDSWKRKGESQGICAPPPKFPNKHPTPRNLSWHRREPAPLSSLAISWFGSQNCRFSYRKCAALPCCEKHRFQKSRYSATTMKCDYEAKDFGRSYQQEVHGNEGVFGWGKGKDPCRSLHLGLLVSLPLVCIFMLSVQNWSAIIYYFFLFF